MMEEGGRGGREEGRETGGVGVRGLIRGGGVGGCTNSEWNSMNNDGLDFDLLAEYLLEDINDGGFDFR